MPNCPECKKGILVVDRRIEGEMVCLACGYRGSRCTLTSTALKTLEDQQATEPNTGDLI